MAKLADLLGKYLVEWPDGVVGIEQCDDGDLCADYDDTKRNFKHLGLFLDIADDQRAAYVTKSQYLAARDRIATNVQATQEAREIAQTGTMTNEEQELADIACGKRISEDQALWDKVALTSTLEYMGSEPNLIGSIPVEEFVGWGADVADAFMTERAKRLATK